MINYVDYAMRHVRLAVLRALVEQPSGTLNDSVLFTALTELGLPITRDQLRTEIGWLAEQGLVRINRPRASLIVVALRERGAEVGLGRAVVDGVQRPIVGQ